MKSFGDNTDGNISILFGFLAIVIFGMAGLGLDYTLWTKQRAELQQAADAAAIAGAIELGRGGFKAETRAHDKAMITGDSNRSGAISSAIGAVVVNAADQSVTMTYTTPGRRSLSAFLLRNNPVINVLSTAQVVNRSVACIHALNPTAPTAITGKGSAVLEGTNCAIQVNSSDADALKNSATINATHICVVGGYSGSGYTPLPQSGCPVLEDPFISTEVPAPATTCTHTNFSATTDQTLYEGVYCGGINISSSATLTLNPGVYHVVDGPVSATGSGSIIGDGVVFVLSGTASLDIAGNGKVLTTPPTTGDLSGYSIVQDRAAPLGASIIRGTGQFEFPGIIYMPRSSLEVRGRASGNTHTPTYAALVADTLVVAGDAELYVTADTSYFSKKDAVELTVINVALTH